MTGSCSRDREVVDVTKTLGSCAGRTRDSRGEGVCLESGKFSVEIANRGCGWLDNGTHDSLLVPTQFIAILKHCPRPEVGWHAGPIEDARHKQRARGFCKSGSGLYPVCVLQGWCGVKVSSHTRAAAGGGHSRNRTGPVRSASMSASHRADIDGPRAVSRCWP